MPSSGGQTCALRSEEHTSELQSLTNLVCRLLLEKNIYFGLIMIAIANFMFPWIAILIGLAKIITLCVKFNLSGMITTVLAVITGAVLFFMKGIWMNNFVLWINKFIFDFYHWWC